MTAIGADASAGHGRPVLRRLIGPVMLGRIMRDRTPQVEVVRASGLRERVVVRSTELSGGAPPRSA